MNTQNTKYHGPVRSDTLGLGRERSFSTPVEQIFRPIHADAGLAGTPDESREVLPSAPVVDGVGGVGKPRRECRTELVRDWLVG